MTDSLKWKLKLTAWRMSILWNIFLCTVALQICAPKRKLSGSKEDHSFQPSVRLVHSPSASNISDIHKHSSVRMRHKWRSKGIFHQYISTTRYATSARTKVNYTFYHNTRSCEISFIEIFHHDIHHDKCSVTGIFIWTFWVTHIFRRNCVIRNRFCRLQCGIGLCK